jgi:hypothetical protein
VGNKNTFSRSPAKVLAVGIAKTFAGDGSFGNTHRQNFRRETTLRDLSPIF